MKEQDNVLIWDGKKRGLYEVYYLKWNDFKSKTAYWIRYTLTSPLANVGEPYCELWGMFFDWADPSKNFAVKSRFPIDVLSWETDRFLVNIDNARLSQNGCHGKISDPKTGHAITWNLQFDSVGDTYRYFPHQMFYTGKFPKTKVLSPHMDARFKGTINANGRQIQFSDAPGQQTHLWGTKHALRWAWGHCNTFKEDPSALIDGIDAQIKFGPFESPHVKIFYIKALGREFYFNSPVRFFKNQSTWSLGKWDFSVRNDEIIATAKIRCKPDDMIAVTYMDPDGENLWCNNSKVADVTLTLTDPAGKELAVLTSDHGCAAEFVDHRTYPEVPVRI